MLWAALLDSIEKADPAILLRRVEIDSGHQENLPTMMRLGITIPLDGFQNPHFAELVRHAERAGFTDGWSYETFHGDAFVPVAAAAVASEKMRLGTAIVPVFTRPAALIAISAASVQRLSGGRFILGVGISTPTIVEQWMGVPYKMPVTRLRETVEALRLAFT
jgi:alkanesulfonate monooxygenase SsuD/methylene tetrahydromethanopterin reductase-like flavin-dependent oxidoreductase (luciferase family)